MRTVLAAAAAGALIMGSAAGAMAAPKDKPAPQTTVTLQSVSIKGHAPIDLNALPEGAAINLRATVRDPKNVVPGAATVDVELAIYKKKVGGDKVLGTNTIVDTKLTTPVTTDPKKYKKYTGAAPLATVWSPEQIGVLKGLLGPNDKLYACIADADVVGYVGTVKNSVKVQKRLGERKGKAVRDCVKVIDSSTTP